MREIIKICKKHGKLNSNQIYFYKRMRIINNKTYNVIDKNCKKCNSERVKLARNKNPEKYRKYTLDLYRKNKKRIIQSVISYKKTEKGKIVASRASKKQRKNLSNGYVRQIISHSSNLHVSEIPEKLVEMKRASLLLKKAIKKKEDQNAR